MVILAFSFLQPPAAGDEQGKSAELSRCLRRRNSQAEYFPKLGITPDSEINKNQYTMDEISYLWR